ncbi:MAG TPA: hypothetical protein VFH55_00750 [Nitrospiria bacterium]|nr:hypothetical protein [Nitrospiria bacterium]
MKARSLFVRLIGSSFVILYTLCTGTESLAAVRIGKISNSAVLPAQGSENPQANSKLLVELFLAKERKGDLDAIKKEFEAVGITRIRPQFFRLGNPPENIAIGKDVPADVARLALRLALTYNRDIKFLLPEYRFFPDQIVIGSSAFDEKSQIPIGAEDLKKLSDPALTTAQFHALYRHLTGEDKRLPTYLK